MNLLIVKQCFLAFNATVRSMRGGEEERRRGGEEENISTGANLEE